MGENLTPIAYEAARENFEALMEGLGQSDVEMMQFEFTDAEKPLPWKLGMVLFVLFFWFLRWFLDVILWHFFWGDITVISLT